MKISPLIIIPSFVITILILSQIINSFGETENNGIYSRINFLYADTNNSYVPDKAGSADSDSVNSTTEKAVIIMFDRAYNSQFTNAKPILDKYGFKVSFFVICSFVEGSGYHKLSNGSELKSKGVNAMNWDEIRQLYEEGHDIQSHGLEHRDLRKLSVEGLEQEIGGSKGCLEDNGLSPTFFQFPSNKGYDNLTVVNMVSKFFDYGLSGHSNLMFLNCDGWVNHAFKTQSYKYQYNCNPLSADGKLTRTHKYAIREWSHDREHTSLNEKNPQLAPHGAQMSDLLFNEFVRIVEAQNIYNSNAGKIVAFPIIGYHFIGDSSKFDTSIELFDREMKYLYDNGFKVLKLTDLGYDEVGNYFYIK
jgi:hypothetical protein